jgi:hypothetical protein
MTVLESIINKELEDNIIKIVKKKELKWINPIFAIPKKGKGKWRKIMDCSSLNQHLCCNHFKMEDIHTLRELIKPNDWAIKIDLESAYSHIVVSKNQRSYLGFKFKE